jgi:hypothetical protein
MGRGAPAKVKAKVADPRRPAGKGRISPGAFGGISATFAPAGGYRSMKTFLKILLCVAVGLMLLKLFPILLAPAMVSVVVMLVVGAVMLAAAGGIAVGALALLAVALVAVLVLAAALSPIWLPVLAIMGLVSLCRRRPRAA